MNTIHTTATGQKIYVTQMSTEHLLNYCLKATSDCMQKVLEIDDDPKTRYMIGFYGLNQQKYDPTQLGREVSRIISYLLPYLAELFMRDFGDEKLQQKANLLRENITVLTGRNEAHKFLLPTKTNDSNNWCVDCGHKPEDCTCANDGGYSDWSDND